MAKNEFKDVNEFFNKMNNFYLLFIDIPGFVCREARENDIIYNKFKKDHPDLEKRINKEMKIGYIKYQNKPQINNGDKIKYMKECFPINLLFDTYKIMCKYVEDTYELRK